MKSRRKEKVFIYLQLPLLLSFLLLSLILAAITDCSSRKFPEWIENPYKNLKSGEVIVGVGVGYDKEGADNSARADIAKQIRVKIVETFEDKSIIERSQENQKSEEFAKRKIEGKIEGILEGIIIKERFFDKENRIWYSLAILDVGKFTRERIRKISEIEGDILLKTRKIEDYISNSDIIDTPRLIESLSKLDEKIQIISKEISTLEIFGKSYNSIAKRKFDELISEKLSDISIDISVDTTYFSSPITFVQFDVMVKTNQKPLAWIPIEAQIREVFGGESKIKSITDEKGKARISQKVFLPAGENQIIIRISTPYIKAERSTIFRADSGTVFIESCPDFLKNEISKCILLANLKTDQNEENSKVRIKVDFSTNLVYQGKDFNNKPVFITEAIIKIVAISKDGVNIENQFYGKGLGQSKFDAEKTAFEQAIKNICPQTK
jgi:hypothetical protein